MRLIDSGGECGCAAASRNERRDDEHNRGHSELTCAFGLGETRFSTQHHSPRTVAVPSYDAARLGAPSDLQPGVSVFWPACAFVLSVTLLAPREDVQ